MQADRHLQWSVGQLLFLLLLLLLDIEFAVQIWAIWEFLQLPGELNIVSDCRVMKPKGPIGMREYTMSVIIVF